MRKVTGMGCRMGGIPSCPDIYELYCNDGTKLTPDYILEWMTKNTVGCLCEDGIMPRFD